MFDTIIIATGHKQNEHIIFKNIFSCYFIKNFKTNNDNQINDQISISCKYSNAKFSDKNAMMQGVGW